MQSDDKQWEYMVTAEKMTIEAIEAYQTGEATAKELENDIKDIEYFLERVDDAICKTRIEKCLRVLKRIAER